MALQGTQTEKNLLLPIQWYLRADHPRLMHGKRLYVSQTD